MLTQTKIYNLTDKNLSARDVVNIEKTFPTGWEYTINTKLRGEKRVKNIHGWAHELFTLWYDLCYESPNTIVAFVIGDDTDPLALAKLVSFVKETRESWASQGKHISSAAFIMQRSTDTWSYIYV